MKKALLQRLKDIAAELPQLPEKKPVVRTAAEQREFLKTINPNATHMVDSDGKAIRDDLNYSGWEMGYVNHVARLKDAWKKDGEKGLQAYRIWVLRERTRLNREAEKKQEVREKVI